MTYIDPRSLESVQHYKHGLDTTKPPFVSPDENEGKWQCMSCDKWFEEKDVVKLYNDTLNGDPFTEVLCGRCV